MGTANYFSNTKKIRCFDLFQMGNWWTAGPKHRQWDIWRILIGSIDACILLSGRIFISAYYTNEIQISRANSILASKASAKHVVSTTTGRGAVMKNSFTKCKLSRS